MASTAGKVTTCNSGNAREKSKNVAVSKRGKATLLETGKVTTRVTIGKRGKSKIWPFLGVVDIWGRGKGDLKKISCKST